MRQVHLPAIKNSSACRWIEAPNAASLLKTARGRMCGTRARLRRIETRFFNKTA
jgi:hypothetical protein